MRTIFKYPFLPAADFKIDMPIGAAILYVGCQDEDEQACIWAIVDNEADQEERFFCVVGTGHAAAPETYEHIGTFQQGPFVWHLFQPHQGGG